MFTGLSNDVGVVILDVWCTTISCVEVGLTWYQMECCVGRQVGFKRNHLRLMIGPRLVQGIAAYDPQQRNNINCHMRMFHPIMVVTMTVFALCVAVRINSSSSIPFFTLSFRPPFSSLFVLSSFFFELILDLSIFHIYEKILFDRALK